MGVGRVGRNDIDIVWADGGQSGTLLKDHGVYARLQDWGLVGSQRGGQEKVAMILTGGLALPAWLDGVARISRGTAGGESGL